MKPTESWGAIPVGIAVTIAGLLFAGFQLSAARADGGLSAIDLRFLLLFGAALGTVIGGIWILVDRPEPEPVLRVLAWWGGAMAVTLLMAIMLLQHQSQNGVIVADPDAVRINALSVGSTGGLLIGYFYTSARRKATALAAGRDQLRREKERLAVLQRMISHDVRNDMHLVLAWSEVLKETVTAEQRPTVERIYAGSKHVVELTKLSSDYVSMIVDDGSMELRPVALAAVLTKEVDACRDAYPDATFTVNADLPSVDVTANNLLHSVFRNVLTNAVQHNDSDAPVVEITATQRDDVVRVAIADDGPGVSDDRKAAVFGKGELGIDSPGTGLGLYLVSVLVEEYGGSVWIEDNDPTGSIVVVELKRAQGESWTEAGVPQFAVERE